MRTSLKKKVIMAVFALLYAGSVIAPGTVSEYASFLYSGASAALSKDEDSRIITANASDVNLEAVDGIYTVDNGWILNLTMNEDLMVNVLGGTLAIVGVNGSYVLSGEISSSFNIASGIALTNKGTVSGRFENNGTLTNVDNSKISGGGTNNGTLTMSADDLTGYITNNKDLTLTGGTLEKSVYMENDVGKIFVSGNLDCTSISCNVRQKTIEVSSGTLTVNLSRLDLTGGIVNDGVTKAVSGHLSADVTGSGAFVVAAADNDMVSVLGNSVTQTSLTIESGTLSANLSKLNIQKSGNYVAIENVGVLQATEGELKNALTGTGLFQVQGNVSSDVNIGNNVKVTSGTLVNSSTVSGNVEVDGGELKNCGTITGTEKTVSIRYGTLVNEVEGTIGDSIFNNSGKVTNEGEITGDVENNSMFDNVGIVSGGFTNSSGGYFTTVASGLLCSTDVVNDGNVYLQGGTDADNMVALGSSIINGAIVSGKVYVKGFIDCNGKNITQKGLYIDRSYRLKTNLNCLDIGSEGITNDGVLEATGGTLESELKGYGSSFIVNGDVTSKQNIACNVSVSPSNKLILTGGTVAGSIVNGGEVTLNGISAEISGKVTNSGGKTFSMEKGTVSGDVDNYGTMNVADGVVVKSQINNRAAGQLTVTSAGSLVNAGKGVVNEGVFTLSGGTLKTTVVNSGTMTMNDGIVAGSITADNTGSQVLNIGGSVTLKGDAVRVEKQKIVLDTDATLDVSGTNEIYMSSVVFQNNNMTADVVNNGVMMMTDVTLSKGVNGSGTLKLSFGNAVTAGEDVVLSQKSVELQSGTYAIAADKISTTDTSKGVVVNGNLVLKGGSLTTGTVITGYGTLQTGGDVESDVSALKISRVVNDNVLNLTGTGHLNGSISYSSSSSSAVGTLIIKGNVININDGVYYAQTIKQQNLQIASGGQLTTLSYNISDCANISNAGILEFVADNSTITKTIGNTGTVVVGNGDVLDAAVSGGIIRGKNATGNLFTVKKSESSGDYGSDTSVVNVYAGHSDGSTAVTDNILQVSGDLSHVSASAYDISAAGNANNVLKVIAPDTKLKSVMGFDSYVFKVDSSCLEPNSFVLNVADAVVIDSGKIKFDGLSSVLAEGSETAITFLKSDTGINYTVVTGKSTVGISSTSIVKDGNSLKVSMGNYDIANQKITFTGTETLPDGATGYTGVQAIRSATANVVNIGSVGKIIGTETAPLSITGVEAQESTAESNKVYVLGDVTGTMAGVKILSSRAYQNMVMVTGKVTGKLVGVLGEEYASVSDTEMTVFPNGADVEYKGIIVAAKSAYGMLSGNKLTITKGKYGNAEEMSELAGGMSTGGNVSSNTVNLIGGSYSGGSSMERALNIYGGVSQSGYADGNNVVLGDSSGVAVPVFSGYVNIFGAKSDTGSITNNTIRVTGEIQHNSSGAITLSGADIVSVDGNIALGINSVLNLYGGTVDVNRQINGGNVNFGDGETDSRITVGDVGRVTGNIGISNKATLTISPEGLSSESSQKIVVEEGGRIVLTGGSSKDPVELIQQIGGKDESFGTTEISGNVVLQSTVASAAIISTKIEIDEGASLKAWNAAHLAGNVVNNGTLILDGGTIVSPINGDGIVKISGDVDSPAEYLTGKFTVDIDKNLTVTGGSIESPVDVTGNVGGEGTVAVAGYFTLKGKVDSLLEVQKGTTTATGENLGNDVIITENGTLIVTEGTLSHDVRSSDIHTPNGILTIDGNVIATCSIGVDVLKIESKGILDALAASLGVENLFISGGKIIAQADSFVSKDSGSYVKKVDAPNITTDNTAKFELHMDGGTYSSTDFVEIKGALMQNGDALVIKGASFVMGDDETLTPGSTPTTSGVKTSTEYSTANAITYDGMVPTVTGSSSISIEIYSIPDKFLDVGVLDGNGNPVYTNTLNFTKTEDVELGGLTFGGLATQNGILILNIGGENGGTTASNLTLCGDSKVIVKTTTGDVTRQVKSGNVDVVVNEGSTLNIGVEGRTIAQGGIIRSVKVGREAVLNVVDSKLQLSYASKSIVLENGGTLNIREGAQLIGGSDEYISEVKATGTDDCVNVITGDTKAVTLSVENTGTADKTTILQLGSGDKAANLVVKEQIKGDGIIFMDPIYVDGIEDASHLALADVSAYDAKIVVGRNSVLSLGTDDNGIVDGIYNGAVGLGEFGKDITAAVYVANPVEISTSYPSGYIYVDGAQNDVSSLPGAMAGSLTFREKSLLIVDGPKMERAAAFNGIRGASAVGSKLYIDGAKKGTTYRILSGSGIDTDSIWNESDVVGNAITSFAVTKTANEFTVKAFGVKESELADVYGGVIPKVFDRIISGDMDTKAYDWISRATGEIYTTNQIVSKVNSMANILQAGGVRQGAMSMSGQMGDLLWHKLGLARHFFEDEEDIVENTVSSDGFVPAVKVVDIGPVNQIMPEEADDENDLVKPYIRAEDSKELWAGYIHSKDKVDGLAAGGMGIKYDNTIDGVMAGKDMWASERQVGGFALSYATGKACGGTDAYTRNESDYYGAMLYNRTNSRDNVVVMTDIGYIHSENELVQLNSGVQISGSTDANTLSAGVRLEKMVISGRNKIVPFAGLRYMHIESADFNNDIGVRYQGKEQHLFQPQIGLAWFGNWDVKDNRRFCPTFEVGFTWNIGDRITEQVVSYDNGFNAFDYAIGDSYSYFAKFGAEFINRNFSVGLFYKFIHGGHITNGKWNLNMHYEM